MGRVSGPTPRFVFAAQLTFTTHVGERQDLRAQSPAQPANGYRE